MSDLGVEFEACVWSVRGCGGQIALQSRSFKPSDVLTLPFLRERLHFTLSHHQRCSCLFCFIASALYLPHNKSRGVSPLGRSKGRPVHSFVFLWGMWRSSDAEEVTAALCAEMPPAGRLVRYWCEDRDKIVVIDPLDNERGISAADLNKNMSMMHYLFSCLKKENFLFLVKRLCVIYLLKLFFSLF